MDFVRKQDDIGIVVIGVFNPTVITPKWMYEKNIISDEEWNGQDRNIIVSPPGTQYKFGSIGFLSQPNRIQVTSTDIADAGRIKRMARDILLSYGEAELSAIGINAGLLFSFNTLEDSDKFGNYFSSLNNLNSFVDGSKLKTIIFEGQNEATAETPKVQVNISSIGNEQRIIRSRSAGEAPAQITVPVCSININNHFNIKSQEEAFDVFDRSEEIQASFRSKYQSLFEAI